MAVLPRWKCHKEVYAAKLVHVIWDKDKWMAHFADASIPPIQVSSDWMQNRYKPKGDAGYLVMYEDGYVSWSPTEAFEEGYTSIEG